MTSSNELLLCKHQFSHQIGLQDYRFMKTPNDAGIFRMEINPIGKNSLTDQIEAFLCQIFKESNQNCNCVVRES